MNKPKISACLITFNHENFIRECLEGAISQIGDFDYEIIIGDDCSSDNTKQICLEYSTKYPNLIKYTKRNNNLGMIGNWIATISECSANYIALCEGDDYWTDPYKLKKQVDFLEANPDYVLSFHKVKILKPDGGLVEDFITKVPENYETQETLARLGNYIHTPSVVFKNIKMEFPPEFSLSPVGDYFLYIMLTEHGKLKYLEEEMAVYRESVGIWSSQTDYFRNLKTAQTHALIVSAMSKFPVTTKIVNARISNFIERFKNEISPSDLSLLNTCKAVEEEIFCTLLRDKAPTINNSTIDAYTSKQLIAIVFKRIKKRLLK
jgi:glycosyltransferase involved in cell wall biosynthesis